MVTHLKNGTFVFVYLMNGTKWDPHNGGQWDKPANTISPHRVSVTSVVSRRVVDNAGQEYRLQKKIHATN